MKIKKKFLVGILAVSIACIILQPSKSNAALQSNGGTAATKDLCTWMLQIRQMQELGGTLGRTDTINTTNLTSGATDFDIHMEKNTEYGAMAILSASAYGNPDIIANGGTTTGNSTGIVINLNNEWVAAGTVGTNTTAGSGSKFESAMNRYKDIYSYGPYVAKKGDAISETNKWHGAVNGVQWDLGAWSCGLLRAYSGSVFSYNSFRASSDLTDTTKLHHSRACIVVGTGI